MSFVSQAKVSASVDRTKIVIGETFNLTISVDSNTSEQPDLSELQEVFQVLGTSQSSSTQIINGSYSVNKSWQISLMPSGVGKNTIPPIKLGNEMTQAIPVEVVKSDPNAKANGDLFIEIETDKNTAYVKEQILITVKLFYSISLSEGSLSEPIATNAIVTQLDKGTTYSTTRDGRNYTVLERHYALFAEKSGTLEVNPIIFSGRDNSSRRSFSMFSTGKPVRAVAKPLSFEIKPIPQSAIGKDWIPARNVQLSQQWSQGAFKVGEPITRTITVYVEGLGETQVPDIKLGDIPDVRIYPEQPQTQEEKTTQTVKTYKQVKIAIIPTHEGAIRIPEYKLEWYNTQTGKTQFAKLPPVTLQVDAGDYAMEKPVIENIFKNKDKQTETPEKVQDTQASEVVIVKQESSSLWKALAAIFALLWLITLVYWLKSKKKKVSIKQDKPAAISKNQILYAIENRDAKELQTVLIDWWNQQYQETKVTNLAQIKPHVNPSVQKLIDDLQSQLYTDETDMEFDKTLWKKQVKGSGLNKVTHQQSSKKSDLPSLY
jgi:hypothetical protein